MRFFAILLSVLAFAAQPAAAASSPSLTSLERQLSFLAAGKSSDVGRLVGHQVAELLLELVERGTRGRGGGLRRKRQ